MKTTQKYPDFWRGVLYALGFVATVSIILIACLLPITWRSPAVVSSAAAQQEYPGPGSTETPPPAETPPPIDYGTTGLCGYEVDTSRWTCLQWDGSDPQEFNPQPGELWVVR